jgi:hypothetical protein
MDERAVLHAGLQLRHLKLVIGNRRFADRGGTEAVVIGMVDLLGDLDHLVPIPLRGLKVLRPQEHPLVPINGLIAHDLPFFSKP